MTVCSVEPAKRRRIGTADLLFVFFTCAIMQTATIGMMDDPGLGWHLRYADQMIEQGGVVYEEAFCYPALGHQVVMRAWLSDLLLRMAYGWGGLNAIALLTCLVIAVTLRCIYRRLMADGAHWSLAALATYLAATGVAPGYVARPNVVSFLGVWLVADICQRYHAGKFTHQQLFWLIPILLLWANMHGGFLAGLVLVAIAWAVEAVLSVAAWDAETKTASRQRLLWLTAAGLAAGLATIANPNGMGLHVWNFSLAVDPFIQTNTTTEWLPPDFKEAGWFKVERLILLLPLLAATCQRRVNLVGLAMTVVWLHFALTSRRYSTLWVVIAVPTLCELIRSNDWLQTASKRLQKLMSSDLQTSLHRTATPVNSQFASWAFAAVALFVSPWLPTLAAHNQENLPSASLNRFLELNQGERTFHSVNWGGYLTWHGWNEPQRFQTWIDDRIDVHGTDHLQRYFKILAGEPGWQQALDDTHVEMICIPPDVGLVRELNRMPTTWQLVFADEHIQVFSRQRDSVASH